jgi:hypothetical protein
MPDDRTPRNGRQRQPGATADAARMMEDSIRQAFLTHMGEQQKQFAVIAVRRASVRNAEREMGQRMRPPRSASPDKPHVEVPEGDRRVDAVSAAKKRR